MKYPQRQTFWDTWKLALGAAIGLSLCFGAVAQSDDSAAKEEPTYAVTVLGTLGGTFAVGTGISNRRWVNGFSTLPGDTEIHAFLWRSGVTMDLRTLGGPNSGSIAPLNEKGQVTGGAETSTPDPLGEDFCGNGTQLVCLPFLWQQGEMTQLLTLGGNNGAAFEINNEGQIAGEAETTTADSTCIAPQVLQVKPVIWQGSRIQELPTFREDPDGESLAINDKGQAVGSSGDCSKNPFFHALLWQKGVPINLGSLGGTMNNLAIDINNKGQVVGKSDLPGDTSTHAFLWENGSMADLGTLPGDISSEASGINEKGQVVGGSQDASGNSRAFIWQNGLMTDLNCLSTSPLLLVFAAAINSQGDIVGQAFDETTGDMPAFLATPTKNALGGSATCPTASDETRGHPSAVQSEKLRNLLRRRFVFGRFEAGDRSPQ